jgi:uncharacterized protein
LGPQPPSTPRRRPFWFRALRIAALVYIGLAVVMMFAENSLIFHPSRYPDGNWNPQGLAFEDAWFNASDGTRLHGWYVSCDQPRAVILFAHGNGGNITDRVDILRALHDRMHSAVMIFDYRGYGRSEGSPNERGILADARAARKWLAARSGIAETQIVMMGESLGGGVAVDLAAADGARGLILENTFSSLPDVAATHFPWLPVHLLMRARLNSAAKIPNYHGPLLQVHGDRDQIIPFAIGKKLFDAANEPKQFVVIPGGDHNDPRTPAFLNALEAFIGKLP